MKLARLRQRPNTLPIIEIADEFLFASTMLVHLERLPEHREEEDRKAAQTDKDHVPGSRSEVTTSGASAFLLVDSVAVDVRRFRTAI